MNIKEQLTADLKTAMKAKDNLSKTVIRGVLSSMKESEQRKREDLTKKALKKHNVSRPQKQGDTEAMAAYQAAINKAVEDEKVDANSLIDESEQLGVIQKLVKQRQDSISDAEKADRPDLAEAEAAELKILETYLPEQVSREEVEAVVQAVIAQVGATEMKDMGKVMGPVMGKLKGQADGKLISEVVRSLLSG